MQAQAPDEGPSNGGSPASTVGEGSQSITLNAAAKQHNPKALRGVAKKYRIDSTKSLVLAYNAATDDERAVLHGWLLNYVRQSKGCLNHESVLEYAELARITSRSMQDKSILKNMVCSLRSCIRPGESLQENAAAALYLALLHVDPSTYGGVAELVVVAKELLSSLSPEPRLTRENFAEHEATFFALRQTLLVLSEISHNSVCIKEKLELRRVIAEKERAMELSCKYYPVSFHFKTLRQAVERLGTEDSSSYLERAVQNIGCGFCVFLYVFHCLRNLARGDIDPATLQNVYTEARAAFADAGVSKKPWFDTFKNLMIARQEALKDETKLGIFEAHESAAMEHQKNMNDKEDSKALRYGIMRELGTLALGGPSEKARDAATAKLVDLATQQAANEGWVDDSDILIALLDIMHELHGIGRCNEDIKNALLNLQQSNKSPAQRALAEWLGGSSIEDKLAARSPQKPEVERKDLCVNVGRDVGYIPLSILDSRREVLRRKYLRDNFVTVLPRKTHPRR